jgi:chromosome segregation protein
MGFKSFCEKTHITFSGSGITCIVGPNGCGKSNIVDAISWVLGEQSHKLLRAERMSDCIFNGTVKRPPMGISEVQLTLVDAELAEAAAKVLQAAPVSAEPTLDPENPFLTAPPEASHQDGAPDGGACETAGELVTANGEIEEMSAQASSDAGAAAAPDPRPGAKKRGKEKHAISMRPGEVVVGRRLYRSGQSEYLLNGRSVRLRDITELFMTMGLGPDSYAIIEQGRIGLILNSKPMDRRAIIEEAAGITMYKTKRRLAETKLEASKLNLSRVNDILVEVEKQLASLKRQASKARRYAELREEMRTLLRKVLAGKARQLDAEAERLEVLIRDLAAQEDTGARSLHEREAEQERLSARVYELDAELRHANQLLGQAALELDRAENRIAFQREQSAQIETRSQRLQFETESAENQKSEIDARILGHRESVQALREQAMALENDLREIAERAAGGANEQSQLDAHIDARRRAAVRLGEDAVRSHAESLQAEEAAARATSVESVRGQALQELEAAVSAHSGRATTAEAHHHQTEERAQQLGRAAQEAQARLADLKRQNQQGQQHLERSRQDLSASRAKCESLEQILNERAYTADAVQKLFSASHNQETSQGFRATGLLADYMEVRAEYESAVEQFLREELEYVVVETFDHARAGISLLREEMGGRATFFVDSLRSLSIPLSDPEDPFSETQGVIARLDHLVDLRDPLGPAAKEFLPKLRSAFMVESAGVAEQMARQYPSHSFLIPDGTCYHGRMISGGRAGEAGPLALKRELRLHEGEVVCLARVTTEMQTEQEQLETATKRAEEWLSITLAQHVEAEKSLVAAGMQRDQARTELLRFEQQAAACFEEIVKLRAEASSARDRAQRAQQQHVEALSARESAEAEAGRAVERLNAMRQNLQIQQERVSAKREELAAASQRLASAEEIERRLLEESRQGEERLLALRAQEAHITQEREELAANSAETIRQMESFREEKLRMEDRKTQLETAWEEARSRAANLDDALRTDRQTLDDVRASRSHREVEKARNDSDREYMRQTCISELNAQPEELIGLEPDLLPAAELGEAETNCQAMKTRIESMGPVNMMALEEFQQCEERDTFLRRERDDLLQSIENTRLAITELDVVSRQKFEHAFAAINASFTIAFQTLFGGGSGEMRLTEPDSSGECGIDIVAQPPGKRLQNILLLSGGEKALTALSLLIAVFRYQPSPFCILDEVDAPLDEANVGRFNKMLREMGGETQFIVVTHNRRTMEMGSVLYGVTMQEPGVSKLVSVRWDEAPEQAMAKTNAA